MVFIFSSYNFLQMPMLEKERFGIDIQQKITPQANGLYQMSVIC